MEKINWEFKKDAQPQGSSDGFWYDITDGGYINAEEVLRDQKQIDMVNNAIDLLCDFKNSMEKEELIIEY